MNSDDDPAAYEPEPTGSPEWIRGPGARRRRTFGAPPRRTQQRPPLPRAPVDGPRSRRRVRPVHPRPVTPAAPGRPHQDFLVSPRKCDSMRITPSEEPATMDQFTVHHHADDAPAISQHGWGDALAAAKSLSLMDGGQITHVRDTDGFARASFNAGRMTHR